MDLLHSLNKLGKTEMILRTLAWNSVVEVFKEKKQRDITSSITSVSIKRNTFFVKTSKPIINSEAYLLYDDIKLRIGGKMEKLGVKWKDIEIKFI